MLLLLMIFFSHVLKELLIPNDCKSFASYLFDQKVKKPQVRMILPFILGMNRFAGLGALQGESLQDEPRLRGTKLSSRWFMSEIFSTKVRTLPRRVGAHVWAGFL